MILDYNSNKSINCTRDERNIIAPRLPAIDEDEVAICLIVKRQSFFQVIVKRYERGSIIVTS